MPTEHQTNVGIVEPFILQQGAVTPLLVNGVYPPIWPFVFPFARYNDGLVDMPIRTYGHHVLKGKIASDQPMTISVYQTDDFDDANDVVTARWHTLDEVHAWLNPILNQYVATFCFDIVGTHLIYVIDNNGVGNMTWFNVYTALAAS